MYGRSVGPSLYIENEMSDIAPRFMYHNTIPLDQQPLKPESHTEQQPRGNFPAIPRPGTEYS